MKLITANLRFDTKDDGNNSWTHRKELMAQTINEFTPQILGTQEGWKPQIDELQSLISPLKLMDDHRDWISDRMYPCIFTDSSRIEVKKSGDFWLSETPDIPNSLSFESEWPRLASWIHGVELKSRKEFLYINTHLDHVLDKTRLLQSQVVINEVRKINSELPLILAGDFNSFPKSDTYCNLLKGLDLYDPWKKKEEGSFHSFTGNSKENYRIDWILLSNSISCDEIFMDKRSLGEIWPSDHFPVKAKLELQ